jgi:hypothetical protein
MRLFRRRLLVAEIQSATRLRVRPGDKIVLSFEGELSDDEIAQIKQQAEIALPGVKALILSGGISLRAVLYENDQEAVA